MKKEKGERPCGTSPRQRLSPFSFLLSPALASRVGSPFLSFRRKRIVIVIVQFIVLKVESEE